MGHTGWLMPCAVELRGMGEIMREHSRPCESRTYRGAMPDVPMLEPCGYGARSTPSLPLSTSHRRLTQEQGERSLQWLVWGVCAHTTHDAS